MTESLIDDLARAARDDPGSPALSWRDAVWTHSDLSRAIRCVVGFLRSRGIGREARVVLLLRNSPEYAALYFGVMAAECTVVPLNVQERAGVLLRQIEHVGAELVIADPGHPEWARLESGLGGRISVHTISPGASTEAPAVFRRSLGDFDGDPAVASDRDEPAMIIYTSGTTSHPKGVTLSHGNLHANACAIRDYLSIVPSDRVLCVLPFHFSYGTSVLNSNLAAGAHVLIEDNLAFPLRVLRKMEQEKVTGFPGVPSTFALLLAQEALDDFDLRNLRYLTQAGGPMPRAHVEQLQSRFAQALLYVMYGQTEATARVTFLDPAELPGRPGTVGKPLPGTELEIRDSGEICIRGPGVMLGYWRDPELTAETIRDGWLHTGDLGYLDDEGYLYIIGRAMEMIKVGAYRVSPQEVEEAITAHPSVAQAGVTGVPDSLLGQAIKAVVVPKAGSILNERALKAHCRELLASYKVPKIVEAAETLPQTSSGKVQRHKLG